MINFLRRHLCWASYEESINVQPLAPYKVFFRFFLYGPKEARRSWRTRQLIKYILKTGKQKIY